jgi:hypothetical protein
LFRFQEFKQSIVHLHRKGRRLPLRPKQTEQATGLDTRGLAGSTVKPISANRRSTQLKTATGLNAPVAVIDGQTLSPYTVTTPQARSMQFIPGSMQLALI